MSGNYENIINSLMQTEPSIIAVAVVGANNSVVYSTANWDISPEVGALASGWATMKIPSIMISGIKYTTLQVDVDNIVATSIKGEGHIVGVKNDNYKIIIYVKPDGDMKSTIVEAMRALRAISSGQSYMDTGAKLGKEVAPAARAPVQGGASVDPQLKTEIQGLLDWIKDQNGLMGYISFYLQENDAQKIAELSKIYMEFRQIFGV